MIDCIIICDVIIIISITSIIVIIIVIIIVVVIVVVIIVVVHAARLSGLAELRTLGWGHSCIGTWLLFFSKGFRSVPDKLASCAQHRSATSKHNKHT